MKISQVLKDKKQGMSFEFFPFRGDKGKAQLKTAIADLKQYQPLYVSMTYGAGGTSQERTKEAVEMLLQEFICPVMPHLTCVGAKQDMLVELLTDYQARGVENIMALRGDAPKELADFDLTKGEFKNASDLIKFLKSRWEFSLGAAAYPETHIESNDLLQDLDYTKYKIDCGAQFCVTQMFFDNKFFYGFLDLARRRGIDVPILPGILPVTDLNKLRQFISICRTTIPLALSSKMEPYLDNPLEMQKIGLDWTIKQCQDLKKNGIDLLHFFTLNRSDTIIEIIQALK